ncbi:glycosyltransferase family 2 protein [Pectobacterium parmentieri]|uniref:Glycosyltransferase 2-like domain-containing protein n=2 Tax=Pectobacterium parmentieri TaxID=1905730 RepID=A0A8B3FBN7_PECPM|nr:glycosyltransferase family 2 protein [Pectobacterium parmentieri]AYH15264.1 hypothetical protein C5E23_14320 [Pectobacterium parmentieri]MBI0549340.1 glycosyltransferase family 2 protein [Pectobacterium parmentieri]MBI0558360.1 glycosyltransferase family 2 protein [Pectobacterium parmentieri]MBI0562413.1 glycosyltransferase family 2 protein [Pectobacterium parmentieri]POW30510.1 hypothetical protein PB20LOC_00402 [Pectobacterium parmentieri]
MTSEICSVLIPLFNEERNIKNCFDSLSSQKYENLEVIFIDDGSTDLSSNIIDAIMLENPSMNIKKLYQNNMGAAKARELGISHASGKYVAFLDCDDLLSPDAIFSAMKAFNDEKLDISFFKLKFINNKNNLKDFSDFKTDYQCGDKVNGIDAFKRNIKKWQVHGLGVYNKSVLIKSYEEYRKYNPSENYINNDEVIAKIACSMARHVFFSEGVYYYFNNELSTTKRINTDYYKIVYNALIMHEIIIKNGNCESKEWNDSVFSLSSSIWHVAKKFFSYRHHLSNKAEWKESINTANVFVYKYGRVKNVFFFKFLLQLSLSQVIISIF